MSTVDWALSMLGLSKVEEKDKNSILKAWRMKVLKVHPDKNNAQLATEQTKELNHAKDILLENLEDPFEKELREAEEEMMARARAKEEAERFAKAKAEEKAAEERRKFEETRERVIKRDEEYQKALKEKRHARWKTRTSAKRFHRSLSQYDEGRDFIEHITGFFKVSFKEAAGEIIYAQDIFDLFMKSNDQVTEYEKNLVKRHSKKIIKTVWPTAVYDMHKNKTCIRNIRFN